MLFIATDEFLSFNSSVSMTTCHFP